MVHSYQTLDDLWKTVDEINKKHFPNNQLMPILGNGKTDKPKIMFVFINPTAKNISSSKNWNGPRFPFIGTKQIWRIFHRAGLFDESLLKQIEAEPYWSVEFTGKVLDFLKEKRFYLTNIVKWTGSDSTLPDAEKISLFLPILQNEIEIIQPEYIVSFGLIPFEKLTGQKIKLGDYHKEVCLNNRLKYFFLEMSQEKPKVIPCYFPVGRGNPKKAIDILRLVNSL